MNLITSLITVTLADHVMRGVMEWEPPARHGKRTPHGNKQKWGFRERDARREPTEEQQKWGFPEPCARREPQGNTKRTFRESHQGLDRKVLQTVECGGALLSHTLSSAVPSPQPGLSFRVRKGTGRLTWAMAAANLLLYGQTLGSAGVWRPGNRMVDAMRWFVLCSSRAHCRAGWFAEDRCVPTGVGLLCCLSSVSTGRLHPSRGFHVRPINHVFCMGTSRTRSPMECLSWSRLPA